jgi:hypothetical protein
LHSRSRKSPSFPELAGNWCAIFKVVEGAANAKLGGRASKGADASPAIKVRRLLFIAVSFFKTNKRDEYMQQNARRANWH